MLAVKKPATQPPITIPSNPGGKQLSKPKNREFSGAGGSSIVDEKMMVADKAVSSINRQLSAKKDWSHARKLNEAIYRRDLTGKVCTPGSVLPFLR